MSQQSNKWPYLSIAEVFNQLDTGDNGLTASEAHRREIKYGANKLPGKLKAGILKLLFKQFADVMILILLIGAVLSFIIKEYADALVILVILLLNVIVGFVQEYNAEKAMEMLKSLADPVSLVIRNGNPQKTNSSTLVPGDMVMLDAGTKIPADIRLVESHSLKVDESSLTGESLPVDKFTTALHPQSEHSLHDYNNLVFKGTYVTYGRGRGVVIGTGLNTELGKIAEMLQVKNAPTPLQLRMAEFSKKLTFFVIGICVLLFTIGYLRGHSMMEMLLLSLSTAVAAIPEALPAVITISLSLGAKRLVRQHVLVRKLYAVETLGSVSFICTDKTGTLTQNKMQVAETWIAEPNEHRYLFMKAVHLNHDVVVKQNDWLGDPTEIALVQYSTLSQEHLPEWKHQHERLHEIPFDADRKLMTTIHKDGPGYLVITKGAAEAVLALCPETADMSGIEQQVKRMSEKGLRLMAYAYNHIGALPETICQDTIERNMKFLGIAGLADPSRPEAALAVQECKTAGITAVMLTGDHPVTARAIASELGILNGRNDIMLTGYELATMRQHELDAMVEKVKVYARVSPSQKLSIVKALQKKGHFVAMTGDGVNDSPALKSANIGIAMGITGTDVSKEAAHMILLDDNFATIVNAVKQGRRIYANIRKFIMYIMSGNAAELFAIIGAPLIGLPLPLLPVQILWINLVSDGLPALALAAEPVEKDVMEKPPYKPTESIFADRLGLKILFAGVFMGLITLASQWMLVQSNVGHWRTIIFTVLCFLQLWHSLTVRSETQSLFRQGIGENLYLLGAILLTVVLQAAIIYIPVLRVFFHTDQLSLPEFVFTIVLSSSIFWVIELLKATRLLYGKRT